VDEKRTHLIERAAARLGAPIPIREPAPSSSATIEEFVPTPAVPPNRSPSAARTAKQRISASALAKAGLISWDEPNNRVSEEFRIIQEKIVRQSFGSNGAVSGDRKNLVMVTSALEGEGKTFCAINLAGEVARQGDRKVLLVDADAKPNGLAQVAGACAGPGLRDLAGSPRLNIESITLPTETDSLELLPFGMNGEGSAELFASRRMADAIEKLGQRFPDRLIIFDAPPCLSSSTPHTLAAVVGQVVLVVASGSTQQTDVEAALDLLQACPNIALLLNKVPAWMSHSYGSYGFAAAGA